MKGFTFINLLVTITIIGILALFGSAVIYGGIDCREKEITGWITRAKVHGVIGEVGAVHLMVQQYQLNHNGQFPTDMSQFGTDPWGNEYVLLDHSTVEGQGKKRKYKSQVPANPSLGYDLYSKGPDGKTATPMVSTPGGDDIVLAGDGQWIGVACLYGE